MTNQQEKTKICICPNKLENYKGKKTMVQIINIVTIIWHIPECLILLVQVPLEINFNSIFTSVTFKNGHSFLDVGNFSINVIMRRNYFIIRLLLI